MQNEDRAAAAGQRRALCRGARAGRIRGCPHSRRGLPRHSGRVFRPVHQAALHDASDPTTRGGVRPAWSGTRHPRGAVQQRHHVVSTRFWWMLRSLGFDAAVLDGGFEKWRAEGRPTESGKPKRYPPATFVARHGRGFSLARRSARCARRDRHSDRQRFGRRPHRGQARAAMAGPAAFPAVSRSRPPPWSIRPARASPRWPMRRPSSRPRTSRRTSTSSPIAAAAFRRPSTCSCCISSAMATSHYMMPRWVSGRATS